MSRGKSGHSLAGCAFAVVKPIARPIAIAIAGLSMGLAGCGSSSSGGQSPDAVVVDMPIAYVKRPLPTDPDDPAILLPDEILEPAAFNPGAALYLRDRASPGATETNITDRAWPTGSLYDVKDLQVSADGEKLIFAMRGPEDPDLDDDEQPKWDIWEYELDTDTLRRIISADIVAQQNNDVAPNYLPDGSIVFSSDRQQRARSILLDDGKPQYPGRHEGNLNGDEAAFVLHTMGENGTDIDQITYNQSHDLQPAVLRDGRLVFLRWDRWGNNNLSLYTVHPDGSNLQFHYGFHSQNTGPNDSPAVLSQPRELPDGRLLTIQRTRESTSYGGDMVLVNAANYTEIDQPTADNNGAIGPGQASASLLDVYIDDAISPHGYFSSAWPLFDDTGRLLVGWSQCRLINPAEPDTVLPCTADNLQIPDAQEANPSYGLWIYNPADGTQLPIIKAQEGFLYSEAVVMEPRNAPRYIQPLEVTANPDHLNDQVGVVHIRSVYDFDGEDRAPNGIPALGDPARTAWSQRPARFLRITKAVSMPPDELLDLDGNAFGVNGAGQGMREILGYVPIEPDGSVKFKVPADMAFSISILDARGQRLPPFQRHQNWLQVRAGEQVECKGCHTRNSELPHGRLSAQADSANPGASTSANFPNTAINAQMGETMAEAFSRVNGLRSPSVDLVFEDQWSRSPSPADAIQVSYAELIAAGRDIPTLPGCMASWNATCRVTINYLDHIQPLWEWPRLNAALEDRTCVNCHQPTTDAGGGAVLPAGQLDLRNTAGDDNAFRILSYQELLTRDNLQEVNAEGAIADVAVPRLDADGNPVLDLAGNPVMDPITITPPMSNTGAFNSNDIADSTPASGNDFFSWFAAGGTHAGDLSPAELKLISEWLDIGAQYYNNPFDAPEN